MLPGLVRAFSDAGGGVCHLFTHSQLTGESHRKHATCLGFEVDYPETVLKERAEDVGLNCSQQHYKVRVKNLHIEFRAAVSSVKT